MDLLQYRSNEMFSSTELIRKSKMVFDKISKKDIEKAVILRDGKPSFILMDFKKYEELISEYLELKEKSKTKSKVIKKEITKEDQNFKEEFDEINSDDLQDALAQIEQLDLELQKKPVIKKEEQLKDFWE
jgi:PHD/YefM family antitoxin component YafN of YafNO toxin-antitoxin module